MAVRPSDCVVGRTYLLKTEKGWEEAEATGIIDQMHVGFLLKKRGLFGSRLFAPKISVHIGDASLRTKEPEAQQLTT